MPVSKLQSPWFYSESYKNVFHFQTGLKLWRGSKELLLAFILISFDLITDSFFSSFLLCYFVLIVDICVLLLSFASFEFTLENFPSLTRDNHTSWKIKTKTKPKIWRVHSLSSCFGLNGYIFQYPNENHEEGWLCWFGSWFSWQFKCTPLLFILFTQGMYKCCCNFFCWLDLKMLPTLTFGCLEFECQQINDPNTPNWHLNESQLQVVN